MSEEYSIPGRGDVTWTWAKPTEQGGSTPASYVSVGCPIGSVETADSTESVVLDINTWCEQMAGNALQESSDGTRTITISMTLAVVNADVNFKDMKDNRDLTDEPSWWKVTRVDQETNISTWTQTFKGRIRQFNVSDPDNNGLSQVAIQVQVFEKTADTITTAS